MMSTLLAEDGRELGPVERAMTRAARRRGLLGRDSVNGVYVLEPCRSVHTVGMRFAIDVVYCAGTWELGYTVRAIRTMRPWRFGLPRLRTRCVIETEPGFFEAYGISVGDRLSVKG